jgi:hypothetical protein
MKVGLLVRIEARPDYADEVAAMLRGAQELAEQEQSTAAWFAFRENTTTFGGVRRLRGRSGTTGAPDEPDRRGAGGGREDEAERAASDRPG